MSAQIVECDDDHGALRGVADIAGCIGIGEIDGVEFEVALRAAKSVDDAELGTARGGMVEFGECCLRELAVETEGEWIESRADLDDSGGAVVEFPAHEAFVDGLVVSVDVGRKLECVGPVDCAVGPQVVVAVDLESPALVGVGEVEEVELVVLLE